MGSGAVTREGTMLNVHVDGFTVIFCGEVWGRGSWRHRDVVSFGVGNKPLVFMCLQQVFSHVQKSSLAFTHAPNPPSNNPTTT